MNVILQQNCLSASDVVPGLDCCVYSNHPKYCRKYEEKRPYTSTKGYVLQEIGEYITNIQKSLYGGFKYGDSLLMELHKRQTNDVHFFLVAFLMVTFKNGRKLIVFNLQQIIESTCSCRLNLPLNLEEVKLY